MKCPNCGKDIQETWKFCRHCGAIVPRKETKTAANNTERETARSKQPKKRKRLALLLSVAITAAVIAIGVVVIQQTSRKNATRREIQRQVMELTSGDINRVNVIIFPYKERSNDSNPFFPIEVDDEVIKSDGIISYILSLDVISVDEISSNYIKYTIETPNLSHFFSECMDELLNAATEQEVAAILMNYSSQSESVINTVLVPYSKQDEKTIVDYTPEFISAITGGLIDGYSEFLQAFYDEYLAEVGQ